MIINLKSKFNNFMLNFIIVRLYSLIVYKKLDNHKNNLCKKNHDISKCLRSLTNSTFNFIDQNMLQIYKKKSF